MIKTITQKDLQEVFAPRPRICHKGMFGTVALFGGSQKYSGAVKLANMASAAMRGGCGVVRLAVEESLAAAVAPYLLESTLASYRMNGSIPVWDEVDAALSGVCAVGCGMGWEANDTSRALVSHILAHADCPVVVDAGGLRVLAEDPTLFARRGCPMILTPHPGEFASLGGSTVGEVTAHPVPRAEEYARSHACIVVLKGATTIVTDGEETYEVDRGGAGMATAGSGDVLAGVLVGMLGYLEPTLRNIAAGVYLTGLAGEIAEEEVGDIAMVASDTIRALPIALKQIRI